jgi:hypothetical protein
MGKMKQLSIDEPMITSGYLHRDPNADPRVYILNSQQLTREYFIEQVLKDLYLNTDRTDIREQLDNLLNDDNLGELLCIGKNQYMSYIPGDIDGDPEYVGTIIQTENIEETYPLKKFEVSYDVEVKPLTPDIFQRGRKKWKRVSEIVEATRFRDAKEIIQERFKNDEKGRKIKSIDVSEFRG